MGIHSITDVETGRQRRARVAHSLRRTRSVRLGFWLAVVSLSAGVSIPPLLSFGGDGPILLAQVVGEEAEMQRLQTRAEEAIANGDPDGAALHSGKAALMAAQLVKQHQEPAVAGLYRGAEALFRAQEQVYRAQALFQRAGGQLPASSGVCGTLKMADLKVAEATKRLNEEPVLAIEAGYRSERERLRGQAADWAQTIDGMAKEFQCP